MNRFSEIKRDKLSGKLTGLCAGMARHFGQPVWAIRVSVVLAFVLFPSLTALAYIIASLLTPSRYA